jgi:hypothetical protein
MKNVKYFLLILVGLILLLALFYLTKLSLIMNDQTTELEPTPIQNSTSSTSANSTNPVLTDYSAFEVYLRANIKTLSPEPAVLGGTFYVTSIVWSDDGSAIVEYEDGHIALKARVVLAYVDTAKTEIVVKSFDIIQ